MRGRQVERHHRDDETEGDQGVAWLPSASLASLAPLVDQLSERAPIDGRTVNCEPSKQQNEDQGRQGLQRYERRLGSGLILGADLRRRRSVGRLLPLPAGDDSGEQEMFTLD